MTRTGLKKGEAASILSLFSLSLWGEKEKEAWKTLPTLEIPEWAERYYSVAKGPAPGKWNNALCPILVTVLRAFNDRKVRKIVTVAAVQASKSEVSQVIPALYFLLYLGMDVMILYPTADLAKTAWQEKMEPAIMGSPDLRHFMLGKNDRGSLESGRRFANGATLFMVGANSPAATVSRTVPIFLADETDYMPQPSQKKTDNKFKQDVINKGIKRTTSYPTTRRIGEACTVTNPHGRIWVDYLRGDRQKPFLKCPHCDEYIVFHYDGEEIDGKVRGGFKFDRDIEEPQTTAHYECQRCAGKITDNDRKEMLKGHIWLKEGQKADKDGNVTGEGRKTTIASFWWNVLYVPWWPFEEVALEEMDCSTEEDVKDFQVHMKVIPFEDPELEIDRLATAQIRSHIREVSRGIVPQDADFVVMAVDPHRRWTYWVAIAFKAAGMTGWLVDHGKIEVHYDPGTDLPQRKVTKMEVNAIYASMTQVYAMTQVGFRVVTGEKNMGVAGVGYDAGYASEAVYGFVRGKQRRHFALNPEGSGKIKAFRTPRWTDKPKENEVRGANYFTVMQPTRGVEEEAIRLWTINADYAKTSLFESIQAPVGASGALYLCNTVTKEFIEQLQGEEKSRDEKGRIIFKRISANHYLDCCAYCFVIASIFGARKISGEMLEKKEPPKPQTQTVKEKQKIQRREQISNKDFLDTGKDWL